MAAEIYGAWGTEAMDFMHIKKIVMAQNIWIHVVSCSAAVWLEASNWLITGNGAMMSSMSGSFGGWGEKPCNFKRKSQELYCSLI